MNKDLNPVYRILDANTNRLREALRVIEEFFRLYNLNTDYAKRLKEIRHSLTALEKEIGMFNLVSNRDTLTDPFSNETTANEMNRTSIGALLRANMKRAQEASRVIEEYSKLLEPAAGTSAAKSIRFLVYELEKQCSGVYSES